MSSNCLSPCGRFGMTEERRQNAYFIVFKIYQYGCYPCLVSIVHWLFAEQKRKSKCAWFLFSFYQVGTAPACLIWQTHRCFHVYTSLLMTFHCRAFFYDPASKESLKHQALMFILKGLMCFSTEGI